MFHYKKWFWPGIVTSIFLTALSVWFSHKNVEADLTSEINDQLSDNSNWADLSFSARDLTLLGTAPTPEARDLAINTAQRVYGVRVVDDQTELLPLQAPYTFSIERDTSGFILTGYVPNEDIRNVIRANMSSVLPGIAIEDRTVLARGADDNFTTLVKSGMEVFSHLSDGKIMVEDQQISFEGIALDHDSYVKILQFLGPEHSKSFDIANADILAAPISGTYQFSARLNDGRVTLSGYVPNPEALDNIINYTKQRFPEAHIEPDLFFASGEAQNFTSDVQFLIDTLLSLQDGTISLSDSDFTVSGHVTEAAARDALLTSIHKKLPDGLIISSLDISVNQPFSWKLTRTEQGVELSGYVPNDDIKQVLLQEAQLRFGIDQVSDQQIITSDMVPEGFADISLKLMQIFSRLHSGTLSYSGKAVDIDGGVLFFDGRSNIESVLDEISEGGVDIQMNIVTAPEPENEPRLFLPKDACQDRFDTLLAQNKIRFASGQSGILSASYGFLDQLAYTSRRCGNILLKVAGHTDSDGDAEMNEELSRLRAQSVSDYLIQRGMSAERLLSKGYGETQPVASNDTNAGKALNRRIEFLVDDFGVE